MGEYREERRLCKLGGFGFGGLIDVLGFRMGKSDSQRSVR